MPESNRLDRPVPALLDPIWGGPAAAACRGILSAWRDPPDIARDVGFFKAGTALFEMSADLFDPLFFVHGRRSDGA
jgi:hypothetical protein